MISYSGIQQHTITDFQKYLAIPGYSFSFLKREQNGESPEFILTDKIELGKLVDDILTRGHRDYAHRLYPIAQDIAMFINGKWPQVIQSCDKQVAYTGTAEMNGFTMDVKGILDFLFPGFFVLDLKVTAAKLKDIPALIQYMGYDNQLWNYGKLANVNKAYLLFYSTTSKCCCVHGFRIGSRNEFWEGKILKFGRVGEGV